VIYDSNLHRKTNMWSAQWYKGRIYTNGMGRGFEALTGKGL
jgi:hypothetical protein